MGFKDVIKLLRPNQWYKNLVIFLAIFFSGFFLNGNLLLVSFFGFLILILISSSNYIFNDLVDCERDKLNPEKKNRPIASGKVGKPFAVFLLIVLLFIGLFFAYELNFFFFLSCFGLFVISFVYTIILKNILFADLLAISSNFVLRAVSGAFLIGVVISPWLIIGTFFLSMFLVTGKRYGESNFLKNAKSHRRVLEFYTKELMQTLFSIFLAILILIFAFYSFSSKNNSLLITMPFFIYLLLRYYYLILTNNRIARSPEKIIFDAPIMTAGIIFFVVNFIFMEVIKW